MSTPASTRPSRECGVRGGEGYVIPAEIDVTGSFRTLLGQDFRRYITLITGPPAMAYDAMSADPHIGTLLPANIAVYEQDGGSVVAAIEPALLKQVGDPAVEQMGQALDALQQSLFGQIASR
jgi:uncharacterized protein (DUF302 family)